MSDSPNGHDIEDVLTSIRRLVSGNAAQGVAEGAGGFSPSPAATGKLVLTPALRVREELEANARREAAREAVEAARVKAAQERRLILRVRAPDDALAPGEALTEAAPGGTVAAAELQPDVLPPSDALPPDPEVVAQSGTAGAGGTADYPFPPEGEAQGEPAAEPAEEPGDGHPDAAGTVPLASDDEALLRALIREIVREELSGAVGERATRHIRKLIRAEVNRVLAANGIL